MITPIRGRKLLITTCLSIKVSNSLKDDNPDKGTETVDLRLSYEAYSRLKDDNPDKGTETVSLMLYSIKTLYKLKDDNPDKGTETHPALRV